MKHVIIGSGAAGVAAARTIRANSPSDEIIMLTADESIYSRCLLHMFIGGSRDVEGMSFVPSEFISANNIDIRYKTKITKIDAKNKEVQFKDGMLKYDKLLIATGSRSFMPQIPGLRKATNVHGLRHISDAKTIRDKAVNANNIVILGAGLVGLDAAYGLTMMGKKPTVVDMAGNILASNLDAHASNVYKTKFEEAGTKFSLGRKVAGVESGASGAVEAVVLDDGTKLACELLIIAAGVAAQSDVAELSGIKTSKGIVVDAYLQTSVADIFAAGDATGLSETWSNAVLQGETAALNMLGKETEYNDTFSTKNTINFFGIPSLSIGQFAPEDGDVAECKESAKGYQKTILRDGVPVGVILQGDISRSGFWQQLIKNKVYIADMNRISFANAYGFGEDGEYAWDV